MHSESEENNNSPECEAEIEPGRRDIIQPAPPPEMTPLDHDLEYVPHDSPRQIIQRGRGGDMTGAAEDEGRHEVSHGRGRVPLRGEVDGDGREGADDEEEQEARVDLSRGEDARRPDESPDDGGGEEDAAAWAGEALRLRGLADAVDVGECEVEDGDLDEAGYGCGYDLRHEHGSGWDLHVVPELEIADEIERLGPGIFYEQVRVGKGSW